MIEIKETRDDLLWTIASDKLTSSDYDFLLPRLEAKINTHGKIRWLFEMENFKGWEIKAMWKDLKFDIKHADDFSRIAMVGNRKWESVLTQAMKPFTSADVKYFDAGDKTLAEAWIKDS